MNESNQNPRIGYKGFKKGLVCRGEKFEIGKIYTKPNVEKLTTCTNQGWHYCTTLKQVFTWYNRNKEYEFCEIEILGQFKDESDKSITTSFKILRVLDDLEIDALVNKDRFNLKTVQALLTQYPQFHVGGSTALFLYGIKLERWFTSGYKADLDLVTPYWTLVESNDNLTIEPINAKPSGNDFDETFLCNNVKVDFKVDPHQRYEYIEYNGFKYKVSTLETIMAAKFKYALNRQNKHLDDCREICGVAVKK